MKFCKKYQEYMQGKEKIIPGVGFKKLKKILKKCRSGFQSNKHLHEGLLDLQPCPVCDGTFFPSLLKEMSDVVSCLNECARKLLELHLASGFTKYLIWFKAKLQGSHIALVQEGKDLVNYAMINATAIRKILEKYDKGCLSSLRRVVIQHGFLLKFLCFPNGTLQVHCSKQEQAFRLQAQSRHMEILQSPWLCELMAFHINLRETNAKSEKSPALFEGCYLTFNDGKPFLSCELLDSIKLDIDLTCAICLDTVFDPVSLTCGHIFCYICACSAASVTIVDGLKAANRKERCPLCRQARVYEGAVHLDELTILLRRSCHRYWEQAQRLETERVERVGQAKEHWESQCRAFLGA